MNVHSGVISVLNPNPDTNAVDFNTMWNELSIKTTFSYEN
jgi:hypothetical protein